jgi:hypothetical protein
MAVLTRACDWLRRGLRRVRHDPRWEVSGTAEAGDLVPAIIPRHTAVLIGTARHPQWLAFDCACGTGHRIMLNLERTRRPSWELMSSRPLTVRPSVDYRGPDRRCHYVIVKGRIRWAGSRESETLWQRRKRAR